MDLGSENDYAAMGILERIEKIRDPNIPTVNSRPIRSEKIMVVSELHLKYLTRIPLKTTYPKICEMIKATVENPRYVGDIQLVVDRTGIGIPIMQIMYLYDLAPIGISITSGNSANSTKHGYNVPKRDIVTALVAAWQSGRFKMPPPEKMPIIETFVEELQGFKMKIDQKTGHDSYEAWLEKIHDDLVLAIGLGVWWMDKTHGISSVVNRNENR
ncbi:MAG: hypothetical protein E3J23_08660 [Candidatus Stahlbacteria bacterium]|nr:MAG: hypothetical protein E3J23_08660 [Candidatus Stahlbacteria bacterium]